MGTVSTEPSGSELYCSECGRRYSSEDLARFGTAVVCIECKPGFVQRIQEGAPTSGAVRYGGFWRRLAAYVIDALILSAVGIPISMLLGVGIGQTPGPNALGRLGLSYLIGTILGSTYYGYFLSQKSATPGKMALGLKVVTASGGRIGAGRAVGRYFGYVVSSIPLFIGFLMIGFDSQKRGLHDYICGTRVIQG